MEYQPPTYNSFSIGKILWYLFLRYHKNQTTQCLGWDRKNLQWCLKAAKENQLKPQDFMGGFVLDEMKVQVTKENQLIAAFFNNILTKNSVLISKISKLNVWRGMVLLAHMCNFKGKE